MVHHLKCPKSLLAVLAATLLATTVQGFGSGDKKVLLRNIQTLTLRKDHKTTHRRVAAVPQVRLETFRHFSNNIPDAMA